MKKKTFYRFLNLAMAILLVFVSANIRPDIAHAMDPVEVAPVEEVPVENQSDPPLQVVPEETPVLVQDLPAPVVDDPASWDDEIAIEASTRVISFGEVEKGSAVVQSKGVTITNTGTVTTYINYQLCSDAYELDAPGPMSLAPGQSTVIYLKLKSNMPEGSYPGKLIVVPDNEISQTINIGITGEIVVKKPTITYIAVVPGNVTLAPGTSYTFTADVRGENNPDTRVNWSIRNNKSSSTSISSNGVLTVGADETANSFQVVVTSVLDSTIWDYGDVNVQAGNYSVTTRSNPTNGGTTSGGKSVKSGSDIELVAAPSNGYKFVNWTVNGNVVSNDQKFVLKNITKNTEVVANFSQTNCYVKVKSNHPEGGDVSGESNVLYGADLTITAKAKSGFVFEGWYENNTKISKDEKFTLKGITSNREITANFVRNSYSITTQAYPAQAGVVFGAGNYAAGSKVSLSAKALDGYAFDSWLYNNNIISRDANIDLNNLSQDYALVAVFKKKGSTVFGINSSVDGGNGTIAPLGNNSFMQGENITFTFAPSTGYIISGVTVDGVNLGAVASYTFQNLNAAHTISVKFAKIPEAKTTTTTTTAATPAKKTDTTQAKQQKQQAVKELESVLETADSDASKIADGNAEQLDANTIVDFYGYSQFTGVLQEMDITEETARKLIRDNHDTELLEKAAEMQYLAVSVNNDYSSIARETENKSYFDVSSLPNLASVVDSILTEDEKISCLQGNPIQVNMNIFANNQIQTDDDKEMVDIALKNHMSIGNFFEAVLMKSDSGRTENITELAVPMKIVLEIPSNLKAEGREYYILRAHKKADGTTAYDFLANESADSDRIIFTTDKFSSYAICYRGGTSTGMNQMKIFNIIIIALIVMFGVLLSTLIAIIARKRKRHLARRAHHTNL